MLAGYSTSSGGTVFHHRRLNSMYVQRPCFVSRRIAGHSRLILAITRERVSLSVMPAHSQCFRVSLILALSSISTNALATRISRDAASGIWLHIQSKVTGPFRNSWSRAFWRAACRCCDWTEALFDLLCHHAASSTRRDWMNNHMSAPRPSM